MLFSALQIGNMAALGALAALPLLILAYRTAERRKRRVVSSVIVLQAIRSERLKRRKFKPPARFFLELLALTLLVGAAASPGLREPRNRIALVIDNTFSMRAASFGGGAAPNRLGEAIAAAVKRLGRESDAQVTVFVTSPRLERVGGEHVARDEALGSFEKIAASFASDSLEAAVNDLAQSGDYDRIVIISDREPEQSEKVAGLELGGTDAPAADSPAGASFTAIESIRVGSPVPNLFIAGISTSRATLSAGVPRLTVTVGASAPKPVEAVISVFREGAGRSSQQIASNALTLSGDQTTDVSVPIAPTNEQMLYRAVITPRDLSRGAAVDGLREDNTAWAVANNSGGLNVLVVSPEPPGEAVFGLASLEGMRFKSAAPAEMSGLSPADVRQYALVIFHHAAPTAALEVPTLLIVPPGENPLFPVIGEADSPRISSWLSEHSVTSYLRVPLLRPGHALLFNAPLWAQSVINAEAGSLVVAGESHGVRFAAVGFELLPFEGARTPATSILTLNLFGWLAGGGELTASPLTGTTARLEPGIWKVTDPRQRAVQVDASGTSGQLITYGEPGPYIVEPGSGTAGERRTVPVNVFYPAESATAVPSTYQAPAKVASDRSNDEQVKPLAPPLLRCALAVLFAELVLAIAGRRFRTKEAV